MKKTAKLCRKVCIIILILGEGSDVLSVIIEGDFSAKRADAPEESLEIYKIDGIKTEERQ